jgi:hypothetical protein
MSWTDDSIEILMSISCECFSLEAIMSPLKIGNSIATEHLDLKADIYYR